MNDLDILEQCLLTCDAPESVWRPILDDFAKIDATTSVSALYLVARIREALGDNGRRMQDELIEYCKNLATAHNELNALKSAILKHGSHHYTCSHIGASRENALFEGKPIPPCDCWMAVVVQPEPDTHHILRMGD